MKSQSESGADVSQLVFPFIRPLSEIEMLECNLVEMKQDLKKNPHDHYLKRWIQVTEDLIERERKKT